MRQCKNPLVLAALAGLLSAAGCIGEFETGTPPGPGPDDQEPDTQTPDDDQTPDEDPPGDGAETLFAQNVQPVMEAKCASCHTSTGIADPKFLGAGPDFYDSVVQYPSVTGNFNPALANILLEIAPGDHYAMTYEAAEEQGIREWLTAEAVERGLADEDNPEEPLPPPVGDPLAAWAGCMNITDWTDSQMGEWSNKGSDEGDCDACHNGGLKRFNANSDNETMFTMNRTSLYVISFFTVRTELDGTKTVIPAYDKLVRMGNGTTLHPEYNTNLDDQDFQRLEQFYQRTLERQANGQCGPAEFVTP